MYGTEREETQMEMTEQYPGYNHRCSIMKPIRWDACIIPTISAGSRKAGAIIWHISAWIMTKWKPQV